MKQIIQTIEQKLQSIAASTFQNLCDTLLMRKLNGISRVERRGSQTGKDKTDIGTPDSLFRGPNDFYIMVEFSTNISEGIKKNKEDLKKCLYPNLDKPEPKRKNAYIVSWKI